MSTTFTAIKRGRIQLDGASREAEGYLELGMHSAALRSLQRRGKLVHSDPHACFLMGECLRELHRYEEAIFPLRRATQLNPEPIESWLALGWCCKRANRLHDAIRSLEAGLVSTPDDPLLNYNLACYYSLASRRLDALRRLKRAFDLDPAMRALVIDEPDFAPMQGDPGFQMLLAATA